MTHLIFSWQYFFWKCNRLIILYTDLKWTKELKSLLLNRQLKYCQLNPVFSLHTARLFILVTESCCIYMQQESFPTTPKKNMMDNAVTKKYLCCSPIALQSVAHRTPELGVWSLASQFFFQKWWKSFQQNLFLSYCWSLICGKEASGF